MKHLRRKIGVLLTSAVVLTMASCQSEGNQQVQNLSNELLAEDTVNVSDTLSSEVRMEMEAAVVKDRVEGIYRIVKSIYMSHGGVVENEILDRCYCSKSWNKLLMAVRKREHQTNTLFFEIDHWSMTRKPCMVSFDEFEVFSLNLGEEMTASVTFTVYEDDTYTPAYVDLVYEDGRWVIDNFHDMKYMQDARQSMESYLKDDNMLM